MRHKLALVIANTGLLAVVLVLLASPLLVGQLLGSAQSGALGVSQVAPSGRELAVYANTTDFSQYASFNPSPVVEPLFYQTSVTITAFAGQQAAYNGLLTLYNPGTSPLRVSVDTGTLSGVAEHATMWLTVAPENHSAMTLLTQAAATGARDVKVADADGFTQGTVLIGGQVLTAAKKDGTTLRLGTPLVQPAAVGEKVYLGAVYYAKELKPKVAKTQTIILPPQGRASATLVVAADGGPEQQQIVLPLAVVAE